MGIFDRIEEKTSQMKENKPLTNDKILQHYNLNNLKNIENEEIMEFLKEQTIRIHNTTNKMYSELGKIFFEAQKKLSNNRNGIFENWYKSLGFSKQAVYRLLNRYRFILINKDKKKLIDSLPISLSYEISNPNSNPKLVEQILNGEVTTLKEYMEIKKELLMITHKKEEDKFLFSDINIEYSSFFKNINKLKKIEKKFNNLPDGKKEKIKKKVEEIDRKIKEILEEMK